jgi:nucleotide-binding universal stress UspA family protein
MSRRIVVGLDGSPFSQAALDLALRRAQHFNSTVIGVAVVDASSIDHLSAGAQPGAMHVAESTVARITSEAKRHAEEHVAAFRVRCAESEVQCEDVIHTGTPADALLRESRTADLLVLGLRTHFGYPPSQPDDTLLRILQQPIAPVVAVPADAPLPAHIIFAYDGSPGSARALQAYVHVTPFLPKDFPVSLLCVAREYDQHKYDLEKAAEFLRAHSFQPQLIVRTGTPAEAILQAAGEHAPALVILGTPPYRGIGERIFGSVAGTVLKNESVAVFVFH